MARSIRFRHLAAVAVLLGWGGALLPAEAVEAQRADPFALRLFARDPANQKVRACFTRVYDAGHLARHPKQKVGAMLLLVAGERDPEAKSITYSFRLGVKFRGRATRYESAGGCRHAEATDEAGKASGAAARLGCGVDCDGGGLEAVLADDDKSVLISVERVSIWEKNKDDAEFRQSLEADEDDRSFRLERARLADCLPLAEDKKEAAAFKRAD